MKESLFSKSRPGIEVTGDISQYKDVLTTGAWEFITKLSREFSTTRKNLLEERVERQYRINAGEMPDFLPETSYIRVGDWKVSPVPKDLEDRRVEITGPVDRKMIINALNSGANVYMADFEDSHSPTWDATMQGQKNLMDTVDRTITYETPNKKYSLHEKTATLMVRPRGWHLDEKHVLIDGERISASLFDFGLFFYHNARKSREKGTGTYFYLPKMESHLEARLWNDVFNFSEDELNVPIGTIKATVLIETILAAFEMHEILYELKKHSAGLNCGRWDYIFSYIKKFGKHPEFVTPDRSQVTMTQHFLKSYSSLLIQTCHRRGVHAMGGMAAQIPIKNDQKANEIAMDKVRDDKIREVLAGHDGTWVAHPGLVELAKTQFDTYMPTSNQFHILREDVNVTAADLLKVPEGKITLNGLRTNINVGIQYLESWLSGNGCVPLYNIMEDAATAEISRTQAWQWLHHNAKMEDGNHLTLPLFQDVLADELCKVKESVGEQRFNSGKYLKAAKMFQGMIESKVCEGFLTSVAYEEL